MTNVHSTAAQGHNAIKGSSFAARKVTTDPGLLSSTFFGFLSLVSYLGSSGKLSRWLRTSLKAELKAGNSQADDTARLTIR